jgi:hypothetical protein
MEHVYDMWNIALNRKHIIQVKFRLKIAKVGVSLGLVWSPKPTLAQSSSMQAGEDPLPTTSSSLKEDQLLKQKEPNLLTQVQTTM